MIKYNKQLIIILNVILSNLIKSKIINDKLYVINFKSKPKTEKKMQQNYNVKSNEWDVQNAQKIDLN